MENLKYIRKIRNLSMKQLGEKVGVSESTISLYENGKRQPDHEMLKKLSSVLNVSIDFLLGINSPTKLNDKIAFLMNCNTFSIRRLAKSMNTSEALVKEWIDGSTIPTATQIVLLAKLFGVASDYLLYDCNYVPSQFRNLSDKEWAALDIYQETKGELVGKSLLYSDEDKEDVYPILKKIKAAHNGLPLSAESSLDELDRDLLSLTSSMNDDEKNAVLGYAARIVAKHKKED